MISTLLVSAALTASSCAVASDPEVLAQTGQDLDTPDKDRGRHDVIGAVDRRGARIAAIAPEGTLSAFNLDGRTLSWRGPERPERTTLSGNASRSCRGSNCWL